jgi:ribosomal protein S18 acetylase RimI-like enzyme
VRIVQATTPDEVEEARTLFSEYAAGLGFSLCFQGFDKELSGLPGDYAPPSGRLLLAYDDEQLLGCIALRRHDDVACEMKRLFLRPAARGKGAGRVLVDQILAAAREIGYQRMVLDTVPGTMDKAIELYRSIGFREIAPYYDSPVTGALFMDLEL